MFIGGSSERLEPDAHGAKVLGLNRGGRVASVRLGEVGGIGTTDRNRIDGERLGVVAGEGDGLWRRG